MFETRELFHISFALDRSINFHEWLIEVANEEDNITQWENDLEELISLNDKVTKLIAKSVADKTVEVPKVNFGQRASERDIL